MKKFLTITGRTLSLFLLVAILLFSAAPYLLNNQLIPRLLSKNVINGFTVRISQLTPWSVTGSITIGESEAQAAVFSHFTLHYTPSDLIRGKITSLTLDGVTLRLAHSEGKLKLRNFTPPQRRSSSGSTSFAVPMLPFMLESLVIRNGHIMLEGFQHVHLPFAIEGQVHLDFAEDISGSYRLSALQAELLSEGLLPASLQADLEFPDEMARLRVKARLHETGVLAQLLPLPPHTELVGAAQLDGEFLFPVDFKTLSHLEAQLQFPNLEISADGFNLVSSEQAPLTLTAAGTTESLNYDLKNVNVTQPGHIQAGLHGIFAPATGEFRGNGKLHADVLQQPAAIAMQGMIHPDAAELTVKVQGDRQQLQHVQPRILLGPYSLSARLRQNSTGPSKVITNLQIASAHIPEHELQMQDITSRMSLVLNSSNPIQEKPGKFTIGRIHYRNEDLAGLTATVEQTAEGLQFAGEVNSHLAKPLRLRFLGASTIEQPLALTFTLLPSHVDRSSLPSFIALPADLAFSGRIEATGKFAYSANSPRGDIQFSLSEGELSLQEKKVHLIGIATDISLPALPELSSRPRQQLQIAAMNIGNLKFTDGKIFFRIEDQQTLFVEKSRFSWCKGKVESGSLQISLHDPELSTTLYCDRLQFSELLSQLGISDAEGDGSLNGRLPLHFTGKEMIFDDGFLFSTPGNSGIVRFNNTAVLRKGMPEMGKAAYLDYSIQAMENFSYNWTKLTFNSQGDDLLISMQIDGKPATPLPFGYRSGQLVPQPQGSGIQHPIRLDVNFHLPFAEMFKYGQNLQKIMENMQ